MSTQLFDPTGDLSHRLALLEASAGTGKTHSITSLFLRLVAEPEWTRLSDRDPPLKPEQVLVVTFTEAATAEMRERIRQRLRSAREGIEKALADDAFPGPGDLEDDEVLKFLIAKGRAAGRLAEHGSRIQQAMASFDEITISTIHGFCQRMLLRNAFESGTEFDAELVPDLSPLVEDAVLDFWVRATHDLAPDLLVLLEGRSLRGLSGLRRIARIFLGNPDLAMLPEGSGDFDAGAWQAWRDLQAAFARRWKSEGAKAFAILEEAAASGTLNQRSHSAGQVAGRWQALGELALLAARGEVDPFDEDALGALSWCGRDRIEGAVTKAARKEGRDLPPLPPFFDLAQEMAGAFEGARANAHRYLMKIRHDFRGEVREVVSRRKRERHVQGFDDLLRSLREGLEEGANQEELRRAIAAQYRVAIIDEFQDTDPVQWAIFSKVFGTAGKGEAPGHLWLVGDPKQAIYAFRQADIEAYLRAKDTQGMQCRRLGENWRSDGRLVDAVNAVFGRPGLVDPFLKPGIPYEQVTARHREPRWEAPSGEAWSAPLRIAFLGREDPGKFLSKERAGERIPPFVAGDIRDFLNSEARVRDPVTREWRRVEPGDVAVLVRSHFQGREIEKELRRVGIPCVRRTQDSVFESEEAGELRRVLQAVLAPGDRRAVRSGLATGILGVQSGQMSDLEMADRLADEWRDRLEDWGRTWARDGFMRMFRNVLAGRRVVERSLAREDGERRVTNLLHLAEMIHDASKRENLRPEGQVAWLAEQARGEDGAGGDPEARLLRLESDAKAARIVTIHACKGLQYPFVWCPYLWDGKLLQKDDFPKFHREDGATVAVDVAGEGPAYPESQARAEVESLAENLRLAYVAMTRALHACTLVTGGIRSLEESALGILMHQETGLPGTLTAAERRARLKAHLHAPGRKDDPSVDDAFLRRQLEDLAKAAAAGASPAIVLFDMATTSRDGQAFRPRPAPCRPLEAEPFEPWRDLDPTWHWSSFTGMTRKAPEEAAPDGRGQGRDYDQQPGGDGEDGEGGAPRVAPKAPAEPPPWASQVAAVPDEAVPLDGFSRGRAAGEFLHKVFEALDFTAPGVDLLEAVVGRQRDGFGVAVPRPEALCAGLRRVLDTPLGIPVSGIPWEGAGGGPRLAELPRKDTLREMDFVMPAAGGFRARSRSGDEVAAADVAAAMGTCRDPVVTKEYVERLSALGFATFRGFLNGAVDLVFRWGAPGEGARWYVVDYKSNRLPHGQPEPGTWRDYVPGRLLDEMRHAHYVLQYHLYLVALHRHLRSRLRDYSYDRDVGGVYYLFLRGMQGSEARGDSGVFRDRPPRERIEALSDLFDRRGMALPGAEVVP